MDGDVSNCVYVVTNTVNGKQYVSGRFKQVKGLTFWYVYEGGE